MKAERGIVDVLGLKLAEASHQESDVYRIASRLRLSCDWAR